MKTSIDLKLLKEKCPMPELLRRMGMAKYAKTTCPSPFRADTKPSWGIFQRDGHWYFKDLATDEKGDEIGLLARHLKLDEKKDFKAILQQYQNIANQTAVPTDVPMHEAKSATDGKADA